MFFYSKFGDIDSYEWFTGNKLNQEDDYLELFSECDVCWDDDWDEDYGRYGVKDKNGNIVIEAQYDFARQLSFDLLPVGRRIKLTNHKGEEYWGAEWGYIDRKGNIIIPYKFRMAYGFNKYGVALVKDEYNSDWYLIDKKGNPISGTAKPYYFQYDYVGDRTIMFSDEEENYCEEEPHGLYDTKNRKVIWPAIADDFIEFREDLIAVYDRTDDFFKGPWYQHYIDSEGNERFPWLVGKGFNRLDEPNSKGYAIVALAEYNELPKDATAWTPHNNKKYDRKWLYGVADDSGNVVIDIIYDSVEEIEICKYKCILNGEEKIISFID